jgi:hypothetical protein
MWGWARGIFHVFGRNYFAPVWEPCPGEYRESYSNDKDIIGAAGDAEAWFMKFIL